MDFRSSRLRHLCTLSTFLNSSPPIELCTECSSPVEPVPVRKKSHNMSHQVKIPHSLPARFLPLARVGQNLADVNQKEIRFGSVFSQFGFKDFYQSFWFKLNKIRKILVKFGSDFGQFGSEFLLRLVLFGKNFFLENRTNRLPNQKPNLFFSC